MVLGYGLATMGTKPRAAAQHIQVVASILAVPMRLLAVPELILLPDWVIRL